MMQIRQYVIASISNPEEAQPLVVPLGAELESVDLLGVDIVAFVLVNTDEKQTEQWEWQIKQTGQDLIDIHQFDYWAAITDQNGDVWHVWKQA